MTPFNPLTADADGDADDIALVRRIQNSDRDALEALVVRHQDWVYNIAVRGRGMDVSTLRRRAR
jgi:hypothetical protein